MKIKYFLLPFLISFVLISCHNNKQNDGVEYIYLEPQDNLKTLLDSFLVENNKKDSIYELYIQRITPWEYDKFESTITEITIYGGRYPLGSEKRKKKSKMAVKVDNVTFFVYSGIENYFSTNYKYAENQMKDEPYGNVWLIRDSANIYTYFIKTTIQAPPASDIPSDIKFIPPTIEN
jgi:hypothetical protein